MNYLKYAVGVDVAQNELVCCYGAIDYEMNHTVVSSRAFPNTGIGFKDCVKWMQKVHHNECLPQFVMEATGVYHQKFAHFLHINGYDVAIVLPNKISNYMRSMNLKTITDATSAQAICSFGLGKNLSPWVPAKPVYALLRQLTRERDQLISERTIIKNQLHALEAGAFVHNPSLLRLQERKTLLDSQVEKIKDETHQAIANDEQVKAIVTMVTTIPGVGELTAAIVLGETNGFELIKNKRQLASYAGLDIKRKESGTSVKAKETISKKGNKYLRKAMYLPALSAIRHNTQAKATYTRLEMKHGIKMKAAVAIQRKLLELIYILSKTMVPYNPNYEQEKGQQARVVAPLESDLCRF